MDWNKIGTAAVSGATGLLGMIGQNQRATKQHNRQKELMGIQFENQKLLNQQGHDLQMQLWKNTNHPAQVKMMQEAGLNPALMYGMSGGGSATTGSQGGGSAAGGQAAAPMDIGQALNAAKIAAEIGNIKADTKNKEQDTEVKDKQEGKLYYEGRNAFLDNVIKEFEMGSTGRTDINRIISSSRYGTTQISEGSIIGRKKISEIKSMEEKEEVIKQELANLKVEEKASEEGIKLTKEQARKIYHDILQGWAKTGIQAINSVQLKSIIDKVLGKKGKPSKTTTMTDNYDKHGNYKGGSTKTTTRN